MLRKKNTLQFAPKIDKTQKHLQENEVFYRHLSDLSPEAVVVHTDGKIVYINPAGVKLIGAKNAKELIGRSVMDFIHPDSLPVIKKRITSILNKQKVAPFAEEKFISIKGDIVIAEVKTVPFVLQGKPAILAILHDITERKKVEERQHYLFEISSLLTTSLDYKTTLKNISTLLVPSMADYIRIVVRDTRNQTIELTEHHVNPQKRHLVRELYDLYKGRTDTAYGVGHILATGKAEIMEKVTPEIVEKYAEMRKVIARLGLVSYMGVPLRVRGKVIGALTFSSVQKERMYSKNDLHFAEEIAARISYAIDNSRLYQDAQRYIKLQDEFISMASHELRTPLTIAKMYAQMALRGSSNTVKMSAILTKTDVQLNKLTSLVEMLLDTTRIQKGKLLLAYKPFVLKKSALAILKELEDTTGRKLRIDWRVGESIYGDEDRIMQVLTNLVVNAVKYSSKETEIYITARKKDNAITVSVKDFGIGISKAERVHIFDKFYQTEHDKTYPGLGLGLYISSEIIKQHKGKMWVKSAEGKGSTFFFSLPIYKKSSTTHPAGFKRGAKTK